MTTVNKIAAEKQKFEHIVVLVIYIHERMAQLESREAYLRKSVGTSRKPIEKKSCDDQLSKDLIVGTDGGTRGMCNIAQLRRLSS